MNDLHELATNAQIDHWPPHLGVRTDAEKIAYLAERLREAGDAEMQADELSDQLATAQEEVAERERTIETLGEERDHFKSKAEALTEKIKDIYELVYEFRPEAKQQ
jgi:predicted  nucleic acid-binding Zn-ribbon protein